MLNSDASGTKSRVLDSAEVIYAMEGVEGLSLRTIAERASANLAAINYHFRTKSALTAAMLTRALGPLSQESIDLLTLLQAHYRTELRPAHVLVAVLLPIIRELGVPQTAAHRLLFLQRTTTDQSPFVRTLMNDAFAAHTAQFDIAIAQSLPTKSTVDAVLCFRLFCNALPGSLCNHNTFAICQILVAQPGTSPRDILIFFSVMLERCVTPTGSEQSCNESSDSVDEVMRVLAPSKTLGILRTEYRSHQEA